MNIVWWLLGLGAVVGGVVYYRSRTTGEMVAKKDVCIADLPTAKLTATNNAIRSNDATALTAFAVQADAEGWTCAARQMRGYAEAMAGGDAGGTGPSSLDLKPKPSGSDKSDDDSVSVALLIGKEGLKQGELDGESDKSAGLDRNPRSSDYYKLFWSTDDKTLYSNSYLEGYDSKFSSTVTKVTPAPDKSTFSINDLPAVLRNRVNYKIATVPNKIYGLPDVIDLIAELKSLGYTAAAAELQSHFVDIY